MSPVLQHQARPSAAAAPMIHLVHRPVTRDGLLLNTRTSTEHAFVLSTELPEPTAQVGGGLYELRSVLDAVRRACDFAAHQYFGVPEGSAVLPAATELMVTDLRPWRRGGQPARATVDLRLRGSDLVDGVPGTLGCESALSIDGVPCGRGRGRLTVSASERPRGYRPRRQAAEPSAAPGAADGSARFRAAPPAAVGCGHPDEVVVSEPLAVSAGTVTMGVRPAPAGASLDEPLRQAALLAAGRLRGFRPAECAITRWSASVTRFARPDHPLVCTAAPGAAGRDEAGRPVVPVALRVLQDGRTVGTADVTVLLDC